jgi:drug/metabolite transporter (DMT)-like permease
LATLILAPWSTTFSWLSLLPVGASALWAGTTILTKYLTRDEKPEAVTVYLLLLLTPVNAIFLVGGGTVLPDPSGWPVLLVAGALTALSQYLLTRAYAVADAAYLQPFDDLKLPFNVLLAWLVFATAPELNFWPGAALIVAASLFIMQREAREPGRVGKLAALTPSGER